MKILVTGGAGFIGSNVVELLLRKGARVTVLDDFSHASFKNIQDFNCDIMCGDITDTACIKKLKKFDAVIHEAAITDTTLKDDTKMMLVNFEGFKNILHFCLRKNIKCIYASSAGVYGANASPMKETQKAHPLNIYGFSKYMCDRHALKSINKKSSPLIVGLRYFNVYGHREYHKGASASMIYQLYCQMRANKRPRLFKYGEQRRDFIYVKDAASATVRALTLKKGGIFNVGTGSAGSFNAIVAAINTLLKKQLKPVYFENPYKEVYQCLTQADTALFKKRLYPQKCYTLKSGIRDYITKYLQGC